MPLGNDIDLHWLSDLGVPPQRKKAVWLADILNAMGLDSTQPNYLLPGDDNVWRSIAEVSAWTADPTRQGMPT